MLQGKPARRVAAGAGSGRQHAVKADQLLSMLQGGQLGAAPTETQEEEPPLENRFEEMNEFFERYRPPLLSSLRVLVAG